MNMNDEEAELVRETQAGLATAKREIDAAIRNMRKLGRINRSAGRSKASNACMQFEGYLDGAMSQLKIGHAAASDAMCDCYEDGGIVALGGGGGR